MFKSRRNDWANNVSSRICIVSDLHAVDTIHHAACSSMFRSKKSIPTRFMTQELLECSKMPSQIKKKSPKRGRLGHDERYQAFLRLVSFFEENDEV